MMTIDNLLRFWIKKNREKIAPEEHTPREEKPQEESVEVEEEEDFLFIDADRLLEELEEAGKALHEGW